MHSKKCWSAKPKSPKRSLAIDFCEVSWKQWLQKFEHLRLSCRSFPLQRKDNTLISRQSSFQMPGGSKAILRIVVCERWFSVKRHFWEGCAFGLFMRWLQLPCRPDSPVGSCTGYSTHRNASSSEHAVNNFNMSPSCTEQGIGLKIFLIFKSLCAQKQQTFASLLWGFGWNYHVIDLKKCSSFVRSSKAAQTSKIVQTSTLWGFTFAAYLVALRAMAHCLTLEVPDAVGQLQTYGRCSIFMMVGPLINDSRMHQWQAYSSLPVSINCLHGNS